jgi:hypothetical protein
VNAGLKVPPLHGGQQWRGRGCTAAAGHPCAERLGWGPLDLFGCDRVKPFARIDRAGNIEWGNSVRSDNVLKM